MMFEALLMELNILSKKCQESDVLFDELDLADEQTSNLIIVSVIVDGPRKVSCTLVRMSRMLSRVAMSAVREALSFGRRSPLFSKILYSDNPIFGSSLYPGNSL